MDLEVIQDFHTPGLIRKLSWNKDHHHLIMKLKLIGRVKEILVPLKKGGTISYGQVRLQKFIIDF